MGFFSKILKPVKKVLKSPLGKIAAPLALSVFAPGIGTALGSALGAGASFAPAVGGALIGAGTGALTGGGLRGALLGAAGGGVGGLASGGALGFRAGTSLDKLSGVSGLQGPTQGSGLLGSVTKGGLANALRGSGQGISLGNVGDVASGLQSINTQDEMEEQLLKAQGRSEKALAPYQQSGRAANQQLSERLSAGFQPGDLTQDPGYQFRLKEGTDAVNKSLGAQGSLFSGRALKAAQEYGQGLADSTYNDAFARWQQENSQLAGQSGQGLSAANSLTNVYDNQGNIQSNATLGKSNALTSTLSNVLRGSGRTIIGYKPDGTPIYEEDMVDA